MKKITLVSFFLLLFFNLFSNNPEKVLTHQIDRVTVFLSSAEIERSAEIQIPVGKTDLIFKGISSRMMDQGVKLFITGNVKVFDINKEKNELILEENQSFLALETQRKELALKRSLLKMEQSVLESELEYFKANMRLQKNDNVNFSEIDQGADYFREKISTLQKRIQEKQLQLSVVIDEEKIFFQKYQKQRDQVLKTNTIIRITVESETPVNAKVNLKYLVSNALWKPYYSIRANEDSKNVTIEYQAQLYNDTGNDWENKPISLAILDSSDDVTKPELEVWTLEESESTKYSKRGRRSFSRSSSSKNSKAGENSEEDFENLEIDDLSTRFEINESHLIPSDATPHLIDIISYNKEVAFYNLSIPKVKNGAFLIARILDWEGLGLIDGDINLYYNDTYQGISKLVTSEINDTLDLSLGKDNNFIVSRKKVSSSSRRNLIGFNIKEILTYEIKVKNNKGSESIIEIRDQLPVSESKDIEVKAIELDGGKLDPLTGQVSWNVSLKPEETKTLKLSFSIKYPKSKKNSIKYAPKVIVTPRYF